MGTQCFGTTAMRELICKATALDIIVDFHIDSSGKYVVDYGQQGYIAPTPAAACFFILGLMTAVALPSGNLLEATWVKRPLIPATPGIVMPAQQFDADAPASE